ncbi:hypothetical protein [Nocardiopsis sp. NPDC058789]|uniref:hypothetical protein n=1 Tax=Nocardiopsis sp. NPDC058789 TaxID=3346634 RepID=UPI0036718315
MSDEEHEERTNSDEGPSGDGAASEERGTPERKPWRELSREEVMERLDHFEAKQRANRRRMTGDDVQEMLRERRAERQQRRQERKELRAASPRPPRDVGRTVRLSLGGALLVGAMGFGSLAASSSDTTEARAQTNEQSIAMLRGDIRALENETWDEEDVVAFQEQLDQAVSEAWDMGAQVAEAQNTYQEIFADIDDEELSGDGDASEVYAPVGDHRAELIDFFAESARIIEDEDVYYPGADVFYGPGEIDVLAPWYTRYSDESRGDYADPSANSWELVAVTPRVGSSRTVNVAWLNRDATSGDLLAWARATYSSDAGTFHSLYVGETTIGERPAGRPDEED